MSWLGKNQAELIFPSPTFGFHMKFSRTSFFEEEIGSAVFLPGQLKRNDFTISCRFSQILVETLYLTPKNLVSESTDRYRYVCKTSVYVCIFNKLQARQQYMDEIFSLTLFSSLEYTLPLFFPV